VCVLKSHAVVERGGFLIDECRRPCFTGVAREVDSGEVALTDGEGDSRFGGEGLDVAELE
jgi:hypothetical protein